MRRAISTSTLPSCPPSTRKKKGGITWCLKKTYRPVPNVPYRMFTSFSEQEKQEDETWQYVGQFGDRVESEWHVDLGE